MTFFDRVKTLVQTNTTYTLRQFIESLNLNYETYYSGRRLGNLPRANEAVAIAKALNTTVEYLVTGTPPKDCMQETLDKVKALLMQSVKDIQKSIELLPPT